MMPSFAILDGGDANNNARRSHHHAQLALHHSTNTSDGDGGSSAESSPPATGVSLDDLAFKISMMGLQGGSAAVVDQELGGALSASTAAYLESLGYSWRPTAANHRTSSSDSGASSGGCGLGGPGGEWPLTLGGHHPQQHPDGGQLPARSASPPEGSTSGLLAFLAHNASNNVTETVQVPSSEHVAEIVGRQGCKIKALRAKTNTYIKTPVRGDDAVFVVTGRPDDVAGARREIELAAEHFTQIRASRRHSQGGAPAPGHITAYVRVPLRVVGLVVGPKGATIKRIQQDTHTYIITPSREREPVFEVTGLPQNVETARREIEVHIYNRTGTMPVQDTAAAGLYGPAAHTPGAATAHEFQGNSSAALLAQQQQQQMRAVAAYYGLSSALRREADGGAERGFPQHHTEMQQQRMTGVKQWPMEGGFGGQQQASHTILDGGYQAWSLGGDSPKLQTTANNNYAFAHQTPASFLRSSLSNADSGSFEDEGYHGNAAAYATPAIISCASVRDAFNSAAPATDNNNTVEGSGVMPLPQHLFTSSIWSDLVDPSDRLPTAAALEAPLHAEL